MKKKIFVVLIVMGIMGLVQSVSGEPTLDSILSNYCGASGYSEIADKETFSVTSGQTYTAKCIAKYTAMTHDFGWYTAGISGTETLIFSNAQAGDTAMFTPNVYPIGFYIHPSWYANNWYTETALNIDNNYDHARVFTCNDKPNEYIIAWEDLSGGGDNDHQDTVFSIVMPGVVEVDIDIKPGSNPNSININSKGVIPVAILTTDNFDVATVDPTTVEFGLDGARIVHDGHLEDVDGDGDIDLVLHFKTQEIGIASGDTEATLTGKTRDGQEIEGTDSVRVINKGKK